MFSAGGEGELKLSCTVKTLMVSIVGVPLKATSTESGKLCGVPSFQPPVPLPQPTPARSPLFTPVTAYAALNVDEAVATPPLEARATFVPDGVGVGVGVGVGAPPQPGNLKDPIRVRQLKL